MAWWGSVPLSGTNIFFAMFIWNFWLAKSHLISVSFKYDFASRKFQTKISKICFVILIPKGTQLRASVFPQNLSLIITHPTARCPLLSFFLYKYLFCQRRNIFPENDIVGFLASRYSCHKHIVLHFYLKFWVRKIVLKTSENVRKSDKL